MAKHTSGPWKAATGQTVTVYGSGYAIAVMVGGEAVRDEANAKLIAASPDLLEALIAMEREKTDYMILNNLGDPSQQHTNKMARAAIAKATEAT